VRFQNHFPRLLPPQRLPQINLTRAAAAIVVSNFKRARAEFGARELFPHMVYVCGFVCRSAAIHPDPTLLAHTHVW
jgi:hypothetical protein